MEKIDIEFVNICKAFGPRQLYAALNGDFASGSCVAITGNNGAGKSTLLKIIAGMVKPTAGTIRYFSIAGDLSLEKFRQQTGFLTPELQFYDSLTAKENLHFFAGISGVKLPENQIESILEKVELSSKSQERLQSFSTGMRQRLKLALLLVVKRSVWFLDEPSSNLDRSGRILIEKAIREACDNGQTILLATNDAAEVEYADHVIGLS
jgi:heme exporter protein A